jgi:hypothetical protein
MEMTFREYFISYYRVESSDALNAIYDLLYPQAAEPPMPVKK